MKKYLILAVILMLVIDLTAQNLIATSNNAAATANHNQRKIVRDSYDNTYIVFVDINDQGSVIKGVMYDSIAGQWNTAVEIISGKNPALSISFDDRIHLMFESY